MLPDFPSIFRLMLNDGLVDVPFETTWRYVPIPYYRTRGDSLTPVRAPAKRIRQIWPVRKNSGHGETKGTLSERTRVRFSITCESPLTSRYSMTHAWPYRVRSRCLFPKACLAKDGPALPRHKRNRGLRSTFRTRYPCLRANRLPNPQIAPSVTRLAVFRIVFELLILEEKLLVR
jgi:hypothetical protein